MLIGKIYHNFLSSTWLNLTACSFDTVYHVKIFTFINATDNGYVQNEYTINGVNLGAYRCGFTENKIRRSLEFLQGAAQSAQYWNISVYNGTVFPLPPDSIPPTITNPVLNDTSPNKGDHLNWSCIASDQALSYGWCSWNDSGSWVNFSKKSRR